MAKSGKRTYARDGKGRFASTPGSAAKKAAKSTSGRKSTLGARTGLKGSRAKLKAKDKADQTLQTNLSTRAQKGAVTRGSRKLAAAKVAAKTRISGGRKGVIGKPKRLKPGALATKGVSSAKSRRFAAPGATSGDIFSRAKRTKFPTRSITPDVTDRPPLKKSAAMLTRQRARSVYGNQLLKGTKPADGSFNLSSKEAKAPFGRFSTVKNPAPAKSFPSQAPLRSKKGELVARKGRMAAAAAARKALKAKPLTPTPKPPTRAKGSRTTLPRTSGTVAKPKGLKPAVKLSKGKTRPGQIERATARALQNQLNSEDPRNKNPNARIYSERGNRPGKKQMRSMLRADSALDFYRDPAKALRTAGINRTKSGYRVPRELSLNFDVWPKRRRKPKQ